MTVGGCASGSLYPIPPAIFFFGSGYLKLTFDARITMDSLLIEVRRGPAARSEDLEFGFKDEKNGSPNVR